MVFILASLVLSAGLVMSHPSDVRRALTLQRAPTGQDLVWLLTLVLGALFVLGATSALFTLLSDRSPFTDERLSARILSVVTVLWCVLAAAPLLRQIARRAPDPNVMAAARGMIGATLVGAGLLFGWVAFGLNALASGPFHPPHAVSSVSSLTICGLAIGLGVAMWRQGWTHANGQVTDRLDGLGAALGGGAAGLRIGVVVCIFVCGIEVAGAAPRLGAVLAAVISAAIGAAWMSQFHRLAARNGPLWRVMFAVVALAAAVPASLGAAGALADAEVWWPILLAAAFVAVAIAAGVMLFGLWAVRAILGAKPMSPQPAS